MPGGSSDGVITSSPPVFRPHLIQSPMEPSPSSSTPRECSQLTNLVKVYSESRESLSSDELISHEARLIRLVATMIREEIGGERELSLWLSLMGISEKACSDMREMNSVNDLHSLIHIDATQMEEICRRLGLNEETKRRVARSTNKIRRLLQSDQGQSSSAQQPIDIRDDQLSWSIASPSAESSSTSAAKPLAAVPGRARAVESTPTTSASMAKVAFMKPSSSRCTSTSSGLASSTLCPPSPLNLTTTTATAASPGAVPTGRQRGITQSTTMHFGASGTRSPKASRFHHEIPHVWVRKSTFSYRLTEHLCALCQRPLGFGFLNSWEKCKSCKMKVHTHCKSHTGNTCGLTQNHLRSLFDTLVQNGNAGNWDMGPQSANVMAASRSLHEPAFQYPDNAAILDSSSSTNSSTPSTPAMANAGGALHSPFGPGMCRSAVASDRSKFFTFPDSVPEVPDIVLHASTDDSTEDRGRSSSGVSIALTGSQDSQSTIKQSTADDALGLDSQGSNGDGSVSAELSPGGHTWDRNKWNMSTIRGASGQSSWSEVTIPLSKIEFKRNKLIGKGRFGSVVRGYHFGDVAVKFLNMDHVADEDRLEHFKAEVASFKNTRHDNIVLCLGYCLDHSSLGIVMGLCKGRTLHSMLHGSNAERVEMASAIRYATEICQGVSYLHQKKIIHRDLRTKNIFIESKQRAVITDLGLFSMQRLRYPERNHSMVVPKHWLAYLAPELIREIAGDFRELSFSQQSDVFAFGTIWYELITSSIPFDSNHPDFIIYSVGKGVTAPLHNVATVREVKDILMRCWSFNASDRPSFLACNTLLNNLPKKRLDRSPSYPMVRSYESIF
ncbi:hypothetical protein PFISCL1PPCAC_9974 [Pristionchus fissidentatus]|uniref:Ksr-1 n=1 Tax=Pristionchus fissidentatus TaxID=1538716 RepID=A0AAV5VIX6_9BILA|nr:hypothetical protein PFISCL1PPCAC_9974 [Pristionchus fissidentatus]